MLDPPVLGPKLRDKRKARGWTLDQLATESGVSRSMLSQIERGDANPTFATLWCVTQALGVELHDLATLDGVTVATVEVTPASMLPTMRSSDERVTLRALSPVSVADSMSWYKLDFTPGGVLASSPHACGTVEHLTVLAGQVAVRAGSTVETVPAGSTARFRGDVPHEIANPGASTAAAFLVVLGGD